MRIVLSNASVNWGGVHRVTEILARGLQARGHDVVVFGRPGSMLEERLRGVARFEGVLGGIDMDPLSVWRSARLLRRHRAQAVLALMKKDVRLTVLSARLNGVPAVIRHNHEQALPRGPRGRFLYGGAAAHVTNADATRRKVLASAPWLDPAKIEVIYNGIDTAPYQSATSIAFKKSEAGVRFGFIANFDRRKGIEELASAWRVVADASPDAELVIVGKGAQEHRFRALLEKAPRVTWLGYRRDIPNVLASLDVLVLPSHLEGAPNVVLEAMASRVAVIATAVSGTPELVRDGIEARLVPPKAAAALATAMIELARDSELRERFAAAGHARVLERFTLEQMLDAYEGLFTRIVDDSLRKPKSWTAHKRLLAKMKAPLLRYRLREAVRRTDPGAPLRIVVGANGIYERGWIGTERESLDLLQSEEWRRIFGARRIKTILAEHVWEHLSVEDARRAIRTCYDFLEPGGWIRVAVPDGLHPSPEYIQRVRVGGTGPAAWDHKVLYDYRSLVPLFEEAGFKVELLEYWDENGEFRSAYWDPADGLVRRSKRFNRERGNPPYVYTSLILDAKRPDAASMNSGARNSPDRVPNVIGNE